TLLQEQTNEEIHVFGTHFGTPTLTQTTPTSSNANFGIDLGTLPQPTLQPSVQPQSRSQVHPSSLLGSRLQEPSHFTVAESANHFGTDFGTPFQPNSTARQTRPTFTEEDEANQRHVPEAFHDFLDVFRKSSADKLPEHRHYDHKITLQPGTTPTFGPIYSLTNGEHTALRSYIDEMLDKGFIRPSSYPAGSPVLFVPKSDGSLRLCVDYRALNNITVKDRYAIPKIDDLLDFITGSRIFSKIDPRGAYNLLRIAHDEEWKTAFRTRFGSFEYLVMPFGLCNAPSSFQRFMNDIFRDLQGVIVVIYLDDILIFSKNREDHTKHVQQVLERLRSAQLYAKPEKCSFFQESVEFLGYKISASGVEMVTDKVDSVLSWPEPKTVKDLQSFLGFANFYRRFIWKYSQVTSPLTALLRKNNTWNWTPQCQEAFDTLKRAFTSASILQHFDPARPITMETDASDYALAAVISQPDDDGVLHPVAFRSRKLSAAELNYEIHDKEMLAIVDTLDSWRHLLMDSQHTVTIFADHKNLEYFTTSKLLNRRQARWSIFIVDYDFRIIYRPGLLGGKPDALTRRPDYHPGTATKHYASNNPQNFKTLLPQDKHNFSPPTSTPTPTPTPAQARATYTVRADPELLNRLSQAYDLDSHLQDHRADYQEVDGLLLRDKRLYVPESLRVDILKSRHDHPLAGHHGRRKTLDLVRRDFFWPHMRKFIHNYVDTCDSCSRTKPQRHKPYGPLHSLHVPIRPWTDVAMDFVEALPNSFGFDAILVIVERLTKMALFIPTYTTLTSPDLAKLYLQHVFSKHGLPDTIVSDRGSEFTSSFWRSLCKLLGIKQALSTAYHPQTDGQTERVNQSLEQYLRTFTNYQQSDWSDFLPLAEFAYNNSEHSTTQTTPFFANKGYHPSFDFKAPQGDIVGQDNPYHPLATSVVDHLASIHSFLVEQITLANERSAKAYDAKHMPSPNFNIGDMVMLSSKNIKTKRPSHKLDYRFLGPFKILDKIGTHAYRLQLPASMKIHNVFHVSLLEPHKSNTITGRIQPPPPPVEVDGDIEYEVERIVDSKLDRRYSSPLRYLVEWSGYTGPDRFTWEPPDQLNCPDHIADFHLRYPDKPGPEVP
ncbi:hypothetical protein CF319_g8841, partial [Tilletia indica]